MFAPLVGSTQKPTEPAMITALSTDTAQAHLTVEWSDGGQSTLSAATLRRAARDAGSVYQRATTGDVDVAADLMITALVQVGSNGVNIQFSDGNDRAIYPFPYLRELSESHDN
jgi:DUF971 family protein